MASPIRARSSKYPESTRIPRASSRIPPASVQTGAEVQLATSASVVANVRSPSPVMVTPGAPTVVAVHVAPVFSGRLIAAQLDRKPLA